MKKLLSIVLVSAMILGMSMTAWANAQWEVPQTDDGNIRGPVSSNQIASINEDVFPGIYEQVQVTLDGSRINFSDLSDIEVSPGSELRVYLTPFMFLSDDNTSASGNLNDVLPISALHRASVSVRESLVTHTDVASISLDGSSRSSYISIEFTDAPGHNDVRFNYSVYISKGSRRSAATKFTVKGVITANQVETDTHGDSIDLSDGQIVVARRNLRNVNLYLGDSLYITANLTKGKKYSGMATTDVLKHDQRLFGVYDRLEYIYRVATIGGLNASGSAVTFDVDDRYYVYNSSGRYIGTTDNRLPYSTKYYLTSKHYTSLSEVR